MRALVVKGWWIRYHVMKVGGIRNKVADYSSHIIAFKHQRIEKSNAMKLSLEMRDGYRLVSGRYRTES